MVWVFWVGLGGGHELGFLILWFLKFLVFSFSFSSFSPLSMPFLTFSSRILVVSTLNLLFFLVSSNKNLNLTFSFPLQHPSPRMCYHLFSSFHVHTRSFTPSSTQYQGRVHRNSAKWMPKYISYRRSQESVNSIHGSIPSVRRNAHRW